MFYRPYPHPPKSIEQRVREKLVVEDRGFLSPCWIWQGELRNGYGRIKKGGRYVPTHWVLKGDPPVGMEADHLCRVRACANPDHIEWVTRAENNKRKWRDWKALGGFGPDVPEK